MYLVDANILIEAKNRYYAFDIAPGFWTWLEHAHEQALACSIEAVGKELRDGNDELADWARAHDDFFRPIDQNTTKHFPSLTRWVNSRSFTPAAITNFASNNADYLLVAYALEHQHVVVTHERPQPSSRARVLIPDACVAMGVTYAGTFQMLRQTKARLDLRQAPDLEQ